MLVVQSYYIKYVVRSRARVNKLNIYMCVSHTINAIKIARDDDADDLIIASGVYLSGGRGFNYCSCALSLLSNCYNTTSDMLF